MMTETILQKIYRFPFKGFPGQRLEKTELTKGAGIPYDRRFAVTNGAEDTGEWMPSRCFFINSYVDGMSKFKCAFDEKYISLENIKGETLGFEMDNPSSLEKANAQISTFMQPVGVKKDFPQPKIIDRGEGSVWDYVDTPISIINAESVKSVDETLGTQLDPLRFRGNFIIAGLGAWEEFSWMGKRIQIGDCILDVHRPIDRCPTPGVNPETGERDVEVTPGLRDHFGHVYCGMYAKVVQGGEVKSGDLIKVIGDAELKLEDVMVSNASNYALWPRMAEVIKSEVSETKTIITFKTTSPWQAPEAKPGQRLKLHLGTQGWTQEYIKAFSKNAYEIEIEDSKTEDPITKSLRAGLETESQLVISGPYGRV